VKLKLKIIFFFVIQITTYSLFAQSNLFDFEIIKGKVIDDSTKQVIPFAHIFNESERNWDYATNEGIVTIWASIGDTLVCSAIGYLSKVILIDSALKENFIIKLEPHAYKLGEVRIKSLKPYSEFKYDFINLELPQTKIDSIQKELMKRSKQVVLQANYEREVKEIFNREKGTLFMLSKYFEFKELKQRKAVKRAIKKEEQQKLIETKFSHEMVKNLTNLPDNEITEFMLFCNFKYEFLLMANDYEIVKLVYVKFEEYKKNKPL